MTYNSDATPKEIIADAKTYELTETQAGKLDSCPRTTCLLKTNDADCANDLVSSNIVYDAATGRITAKQNVLAGYSEEFCIRCLYKGGYTKVKNIQVTQGGYCSS